MKNDLAKPPLGVSLIMASFTINALALALPLVMLQVFDRVVPNQAVETLLILSLGLAAAIFFDFALKACRIVATVHAGEEFETAATRNVVGRMFGALPDAQARLRDAEKFEAAASITQLRDHYCGEARLVVIDLPFALIFVAAVAWIGGWLASVLVASFVILAAASFLFRQSQMRTYEDRRSIDARRYSFFAEFLSKIRIVKSNCMEVPMLRRYELLQDQSVDASSRLIAINGFSQGFNATMGQATLGAVALTGGAMVIHGSLGVAELAACTLLSGRAIQPMSKLSGLWVQGESASSALKRCNALLSLPQREDRPARPLTGAISIRDVSVTLARRGAPLFQNVSLDCAAGECVAITGDDGAGKTTFLRLILGELSPTSGEVTLDGAPAADMQVARGRGGVAYLDQKPVIFDGSIMENLTLSADPAQVDRVVRVADQLGLSDEVNRLPNGYRTLIGGKGSTPLPEGALQLIALVRALAQEPKILLFNEANTAMDRRADEAALNALSRLKGKATMILVSRRPSYVAIADRQVNLSGAETTIRSLDPLGTLDLAGANRPTRRVKEAHGADATVLAPA